MRKRITIFAWIACLGVLLHAGAATASVWCPSLGLLTSCCCPVEEANDHAALEAPASCCRLAVPSPEVSPANSDVSPVQPCLAVLPWEQAMPEPLAVQKPLETSSPPIVSPPLLSLASIVLIR